VEAENAAVAAVTRAWTLDFENDVCSPTMCDAIRGGVRIYRNSDHLSVEGALMLTKQFEAAIRAHARSRR